MLLCHEGLGFVFEGDSALIECARRVVDGLAALAAAPGARGPLPALVHCTLRLAPCPRALSPKELGWLRWQWEGDRARICTRLGEAELRRAGAACVAPEVYGAPGTLERRASFRAEARLPCEPRALQTLLGALGSAVLHELGGATLHASSVLCEGAVVAFLGPSGAGKSTASRQLGAGALFSVDRLALVPARSLRATAHASSWWAYPLLGGTPLGGTPLGAPKPRAAAAWAPLAALLRVQRAASGAVMEACSVPRAVALLRESSWHGGQGAGVELEFLARLERIARELPFARLHFALDTPLGPVIQPWLSAARRVPAGRTA